MFGLGKIEPGGTFMVVDKRERANKPLHELSAFKGRAKLVPVSDAGNMPGVVVSSALSVVDFPISEIHTAHDLFQNRKREFSERSASRIVAAVRNGSFNWSEFDPVLLWENPENGRYYILSGHSRTEAFRRLAAAGSVIDGKGFDFIPAKIARVSIDEAQRIAKASNTLSDKESDVERAAYYRDERERGVPSAQISQEAKEKEGKDANKIIAYSYLNQDGKAVASMEATEGSEQTTKNTVATVSAWIGNVRKAFPQLTDAHENELFEWLIHNNGYGTKAGQISNGEIFKDKVHTLIMRNTEFGQFDAEKPLNPRNLEQRGPCEIEYQARLKEAENELKKAISLRDGKRAEFVARQKNDSSITNQNITAALKQYDDAIITAQRNFTDLKRRAHEVYQAEAAQPSLFGLGKPAVEIKAEMVTDLNTHISSNVATIIKLLDLGIPIDSAFSTVKKHSGLKASAWEKVVEQAQYQIRVFDPLKFSLNGPLGNPALAQAGKQAAVILAPIILEEITRYAQKKYREKKEAKGKGKRKSKLGAVEVLDQNAKSVGVADDYSFDGKPINFGGFVPTYKILPSYDHLIAPAQKHTKSHGDEGLSFVLKEIKRIEKACRPQVAALAKHLYAATPSQAAINIWHFCKKNIGYSLETDEQLRTPSRTWADRFVKVDCDDFAIFCAAILSNMGYKPVFRVVAFNGKPNFQHIYVTVNGVVLDPVLDYFGGHPKNITNSMQVYTLSGVPSETRQLKAANVKAAITRNLAKARANGDQKKIRVFRHLLSREGRPEFLPLAGLSHLISDVQMTGPNPKGIIWKKPVDNFSNKEIELVHRAGDGAALGEVESALCMRDVAMHGLGKLSKEQIIAKQEKRWKKADERKNKRQSKRLSRLEKNNPNKAKKVKARMDKRNQRVNERREANKGVSTAKRIGRSFARFEPLAATGRASFIAVVKLNFRGLATNMSWAILPDDVLRKNGLSDAQIKNVRAAWEKLQTRWADIGGNPGVLRDAILKGYKKKPLFGQGKKGKAKRPKHLSGLSGVSGLGSITESELGTVLTAAARRGYLADIPEELFGLGAAPAIAAAITAAAAVIGMIGGLVSQVVKAAGKKDAGEQAEAGEEVETPEGEAPQVTEDEMYDEAFPEDQGEAAEEESEVEPVEEGSDPESYEE